MALEDLPQILAIITEPVHVMLTQTTQPESCDIDLRKEGLHPEPSRLSGGCLFA